MSAITSVTLDPSPAAPGTPVTLTVEGDWTTSEPITASTEDGASAPGELVIIQPVLIDDPSGRVWTPVPGSNTGTKAVFTGTA